MKDESQGVPTSILSRSKELISAATRIGAKEASSQLQKIKQSTRDKAVHHKRQIEQAIILYETLARMKGAAMKVGQMLSMDLADFFPPEVREVFSRLQSQSHIFLSHSKVLELLKKELGSDTYSRLSDISKNPVAAASIGQVHEARLGDKRLAIKVQYPGIDKSIETDLSIFKTIFSLILKMSPKKVSLDRLFVELKEMLNKELDYQAELIHGQIYSKLFKDHPGVRIPSFYSDLSRKRVLTMSFEEGIALKDWIAQNPSLERRKKIGQNLLEIYYSEFFGHSYVQTDPNMANFLVDPRDDCLVLLDFGSVKKYELSFVRDYIELIRFVRAGQKKSAIAKSEQMELLDLRESAQSKSLLYDMIRASLEAFEPTKQPFDFTDEEYFRRCRDLSLEFIKTVRYSAPPYQLIFLHRKLAGTFAMMKALGLKVDLLPLMQRMENRFHELEFARI